MSCERLGGSGAAPDRAAPEPRPGADDLAAYCAAPPAGGWPPGWVVHYRAEAASTQDLARAAAEAGAPHGTVYVADWQRAGRGRRGRAWLAPPGTSLLFSLVARDVRLAPFAQTAVCALALCRVLAREGLAPAVKWPNDVLLGDRKVAGVLTERVSGAAGAYQIVGIGLNVVYGAARDALPPFATALDWELGRPLPRGPLLGALLRELAPLLAAPATAWEGGLYGEWLRHLWRRHQTVRLATDAETLAGRVEGAALDGALLLRLPSGALHRVTVGDVLL
ncbi:MAG TPA: biotin--[acetyl-CoA-carboxylase] ligase [Chloroflexota bacterium]|nr:biotin--[acetyl-CoA-carboxylase] ligase [Chloroflexota bacterium]